MKSKYVVFAMVLLLTLSSSSTVLAAVGPVLTPAQVQTNGPRVTSIEYTYYTQTSAPNALQTGAINSFDLTFLASSYLSLSNSYPLQTGSTASYSFDGLQFNMLRPITNSTYFHEAISAMWNASTFNTLELEGVAGYTSPALLPCQSFPTSCDTTGYITANDATGDIFANAPSAPGYTLASKDLVLAGLEPENSGSAIANCGWTGATSTTTGCAYGTTITSATTWHRYFSANSSASPSAWVPNWVWRSSDNRVYFSNYLVPAAAKIGLTFNLVGDGLFGELIYYVYVPGASAVVNNGAYSSTGPSCTPVATFGCKGGNTAPTYNYADEKGTVNGTNIWDIYSYGYSGNPNIGLGVAEFLNDQFGNTFVNPTNVHNPQLDYLSNNVINAKTTGAAESASKKLALAQLQQLPMLNIYWQKQLWGAYINGWGGYANIPGYGPSTGGGIEYTGLNLYNSCYLKTPTSAASAQTCTEGANVLGGTPTIGLGDIPTPDGGMNPAYPSLSVYEADIETNIYDSPLVIGPTDFTAPAKYIDWMTTSYTVSTFSGTIPATGTVSGQQYFDESITGAGPYTVSHGEAVTFNFNPNVYFSDGTHMNAYDYNFSLFAFDVACAYQLPDTVTGPSCTDTAPGGVLATSIPTGNSEQITVYFGSDTVWNLGDVLVDVIPQNVWSQFNVDGTATGVGTMDTAQSPALDLATLSSSLSGGTCPGGTCTPDSWVYSLPNLEISTGPFQLITVSASQEATGTYKIVDNPLYYRSFWQLAAFNSSATVVKGTNYALSVTPYLWSYNSTTPGCSGFSNDVCELTMGAGSGMSGTWTVVNAAGHTIESGSLTCALAHGAETCTSPVSTSHLSTGANHLIIDITYHYESESRTWYQSTGFGVKS